ncbi:MAG: hypothetical protein NT149_03695 [Candidatus Gottesmanbacteria bacterium]|nr:hypothetical protein [Candidatus Gottesmanbacteria bacterium]
MNNRLFLWLVVVAGIVLIGWVYFTARPKSTVSVNQTMQATPTPAGSNLGPPESVTGGAGNGLEKGGVPSK